MKVFEPEELHKLIELISASNLESLELESEAGRLKVVKEPREVRVVAPAQAAVAPSVRAEEAARGAQASAEGTDGGPAAGSNGLVDFPSPIVGTFYRAPGPGSPNFVEVGARVARGQVLCIVEAMKVMNEIESEIDAEIADVLATNGQPVEYGEVLFRLRPLAG